MSRNPYGMRAGQTQQTHKGITYFRAYSDAAAIAERVSGRVVNYQRGHAVQYWLSGPYYPEHEHGRDIAGPTEARAYPPPR